MRGPDYHADECFFSLWLVQGTGPKRWAACGDILACELNSWEIGGTGSVDDLGPESKTKIWVRVSPQTHPSMDFSDILVRRNEQLGQKPPRAMHSIGCLVVYVSSHLFLWPYYLLAVCVLFITESALMNSQLIFLVYLLIYPTSVYWASGRARCWGYNTWQNSYSLPYSLEWEADVTQWILVVNIKSQLW